MQAHKQKRRETDIQIYTQTDEQIQGDTEKDRHTDRQVETQGDKQREGDAGKETERQTRQVPET